jgi:hypothetical protein
MAAEPLPDHTPTADEIGAHIVERLNNDGTFQVRDATTGQVTTMRLGVMEFSGELTLVAVGPGSG